MIVCATSVAGAACSSCSSNDPQTTTGKRMLGAEGKERWVVTFDATEPDLGEYRDLVAENPTEAEAYAAKMRAKLAHDRADFEAQVQALEGKVVERWWMSNALTVEVKPDSVPSLKGMPGVKSIVPDVPLE